MQVNQNHPKQGKNISSSSFLSMIFLFISIGLGFLLSFVSILNDLGSFDWQNFLGFQQTWLKYAWMLLLALAMFFIIIISSGFRYWMLLKEKSFKLGFWRSLLFGILARYYVLITPWGLGSQPILIGLIYQRGVGIGKATSVVMLDLLLMRIAMGMIVFFALIFYGHIINRTFLTFAWFGFLMTCIIPIFFVLASLNQKIENISLHVIRVLFPKKFQHWSQNLSQSLIQYRKAFKNYKNKKSKLLIVLVWSFISQLAVLSMPFFILSTFPQTNFGVINPPFTYLNVLMMMALANVVLGTVPTLGSAGAAEFTFTTLFSVFLSGQFLVIAIFVWRFLLFYSWLLIGMIMTLFTQIKLRKHQRKIKQINLRLPLKVFIFNDGFYPLIDGVVRTVDAYARHLVKEGIDVAVVVPFQGDVSIYPYRIIPIPQFKIPGLFYPIPYGFNRKNIQKRFIYDGPSVYHAHTPFLLGNFALKLSKKNQVPLITTFHSKYYDDYLAATKSKWLSKILNYFTMRFFSKAFALWTVSKATVKTIQSYGLSRRGVKVISNGTDIQPFINPNHKILLEVYDKFGFDQHEKTVLFVGQLIWQKNLQLIIDTFKELDRFKQSYQLVIIGEGRHETAIKSYVKEKNIKNKIIFTGKIGDYQTLSQLYGSAGLFFFPSAYDNDPLVVKEAAVHALPSLVMKNTSIAQQITDNVNGFVQAGNAKTFAKRIIKIFAEEKQRQMVGQRARQDLVKRWPETLKHLKEEYQSVIKKYYS
ncbi:MAG: hypothetical protein RIS53_691, partial [Bacillota bacterium]